MMAEIVTDPVTGEWVRDAKLDRMNRKILRDVERQRAKLTGLPEASKAVKNSA